MISIPLDQTTISMIVGAVLSVAFEFQPKLQDWLSGLTKGKKMLVFAAMSAVFAGVVFALACYSPILIVVGLVCDQLGFRELLNLSFIAFAANQLTYAVMRTMKEQAAEDLTATNKMKRIK